MSTPTTTKKCPHCAEEINSEAKKCKYCGEFLEEKKPSAFAEGNPVKKVPYGKAVLYCIGVSFFMIVIGFVACIFVIGAIIGVPLILAGVALFIGSPVAALYVFETDCPSCGNHFNWLGNKKAVKCRQCKQRSTVQNMRAVPLRTFVQASK